MTIRNLLQCTLLIFLISIPVCAVIVMANYCVAYPEHFSLAELPILIVTFALYYLVLKRVQLDNLNAKAMTVASFLIANTAMIVSLATYDTQPCSDYVAIYNLGQQMADGSYDVRDLPYYHYVYMFNYQTGISAFVAVLFRIFGSSFWVLKVFNLVVINLTLWLTYRVAKRLCDTRSALITLLVMSTYYPVLVTVNQFTNQHVAAPLILIVLLALDSKKWYSWVLAGLVAALANVVRPMGIILLLTAIVYAVYLILCRRTEIRRVAMGAALIVTFLASYFCCNTVFDTLFMSLHYTDCPIGYTRLTYFKFDKGLTGYDYPEVYKFDNIEEFNRWEKDKLIHIFSDEPLEVAKYAVTKMIRYQGEFDWKFENTYDHDPAVYNRYPIKGFVMFGWAQYIFMAIMAIIGYNRWRKAHDIDAFQIFYIGITAVYLFIEAFSSYRYESYPILLIFAAYGIATFSLQKQLSPSLKCHNR